MSHGVVALSKLEKEPTGLTDLQKQFQRSPYSALRKLICHVEQDCIVLRGTVPCYYLKQIAQTLAVKSMGLGSIYSEIEVRPE
jgi:hypothetical protein